MAQVTAQETGCGRRRQPRGPRHVDDRAIASRRKPR